jgi:hypothetical protein
MNNSYILITSKMQSLDSLEGHIIEIRPVVYFQGNDLMILLSLTLSLKRMPLVQWTYI